ncbi:MAG TPA: PD-(D/E)XK nuclease family protein [Candidatus Obscuribacterales bacterium]
MQKIQIVSGPYRAGKTVQLLNDVVDFLENNSPSEAILIVPSQRYRRLIERRLAETLKDRSKGTAGIFGLKILSFYALCEEVLRRLGVAFRVIPDKVRPALVQSILSDMKARGELIALAPICEYIGTASQIIELIDEFERAALSPADLISRLEETADSGSKYLELARVYERYWRKLDELAHADQRQLAFRLREKLASGKDFDLSLNFVGVDGFDRFNPLQLNVLDAISPYCSSLKVLFDYMDHRLEGAHDYVWKEESYKDLSAVFAGRMTVKTVGLTDKASMSREPMAIEREAIAVRALPGAPVKAGGRRRTKRDAAGDIQLSLFSLMESLAGGNGADNNGKRLPVEKYKAMDRFLEMDLIARLIKKRLSVDAVSPSQILVVVRDVAKYKAAVHAAFGNARIGYFLDEPIPLKALPVVRWVIDILRLAHDQFPRSSTIKCIRSAHFRKDKCSLSAFDIDRLDSLSVDNCVVQGRDQWDDCLTRKEENIALKEKLSLFFDCVTPPAESMSLWRWVVWTEDLIDKIMERRHCGRHHAAGDTVGWEQCHDPFAHWEKETCLAGIRRALAVLIQEANLLGDRVVSDEYFLLRLENLIEQGNFRRPRSRWDVVTVCSAEMADNCLFEDIYIAGLVEGEFPRRVSKSGFTSPDEVERWLALGVNIHNPRQHPAFESALFNSLVQRAKGRIVVTCPSSEIDGEELVPSFLLTGGKPEEESGIKPSIPFASSWKEPISDRDYVTGQLWTGSKRILCNHPDVRALQDRLQEPVSVLRMREAGDVSTPWNGYLVDFVSTGALKVRMPDRWSATRLSDFGKCPFRYWVSHVLSLEPHEEPAFGANRLILGQTFHKALEIFYRLLNDQGATLLTMSDQEFEAAFNQSCEEALAWLGAKPDIKRGEFWQYEKNEIVFRLRRFLSYEKQRARTDKRGFVPILLEKGFGLDEEGDADALVLRLPRREIRVCGRIDRIDVASNPASPGSKEVRVIDYKTGSKPINERDALSGRNLQLPIYAMAVAKTIMPDCRVVSGLYLSVSQGEVIGRLDFGRQADDKDDRQNIDVLGKTKENIESFVTAIENGDFRVRPNGATVCQGCPHAAVCRISELGSVSSSEED